LIAARGLVRTQMWDVSENPDQVVEEFKKRFYDTQLFQSPDAGQYAGGKFALYLLNRHADKNRVFDAETARHLVEEAQLFIEAAYGYYQRMNEQRTPAKANIERPETAAAAG